MIKIKYQILKIGQKEINKDYFLFRECKDIAEANNFLETIINDVPEGYYINIIRDSND